MGHSSIQVTVDLYSHYVPGSNRQAVIGLDELVEKPKSDNRSATIRNHDQKSPMNWLSPENSSQQVESNHRPAVYENHIKPFLQSHHYHHRSRFRLTGLNEPHSHSCMEFHPVRRAPEGTVTLMVTPAFEQFASRHWFTNWPRTGNRRAARTIYSNFQIRRMGYQGQPGPIWHKSLVLPKRFPNPQTPPF